VVMFRHGQLWLTLVLIGFCGGHAAAEKEKINLEAFGGDPVVSSEIGAEPSDPDDPELLMPTGTCEMPGIQLKECTHDCVYNCRTPMCTWGCVCSCNNRGAKAKLLAFLKSVSQSTQILAAQKKLSKAVTAMQVDAEQPEVQESDGFISNPFAGIKFKKLAKKKGQNPRFMGHKAAKAKLAHQGRRRNPFVDRGNFNWAEYDTAHRMSDPSLKMYDAESASINDVFDPMEDPYNLGDKREPHGRWWAHDGAREGLTENWWEHGGGGYW